MSKILPPRIKNLELYTRALTDNIGLEIGGPSQIFEDNGLLPVYSVVQHLDNCTFSTSTIWEGILREGRTFRFHNDKPVGRQYISEATDLSAINGESYDCMISSNTIEHVANPLKALYEWKRVIKTHGHLLLVVPHRDMTFDHKRPVTAFRHIMEDYERMMTEDDLTHLGEILALHDLALDPAAGDEQAFRERSMKNHENRCLHHHVFDTELVIRLLDHAGFQILSVDLTLPFYINVLARKTAPSDQLNNQPFLSLEAAYRTQSPFKSDRRAT